MPTSVTGVIPTSEEYNDLVTQEELSAASGASIINFMEQTVYNTLLKIAGMDTLGGTNGPLGYDPAGLDLTLLNAIGSSPRDIMNYGRLINGVIELFGIRRNAVARSSIANSSGVNIWNPQVAGVADVLALSTYASADQVNDFVMISSSAANPWETGQSVVFSSDGFVSTNTELLTGIKIGSIVKTNESTPSWGIVDAINTETGKVTLLGSIWGQAGLAVTPASGSLLECNPQTKIWAANKVLQLISGGRATAGAIEEWDYVNQTGSTANTIGHDLVNLKQSNSDCDTGYVVRGSEDGSGNYRGWLTGFSARLFKNYGFSTIQSGPQQAFADYYSAASSQFSFYSNGESTYAFSAQVSSSSPLSQAGKVQTLLSSYGFRMRSGDATTVITSSTTLSTYVGSYIINLSTGQTLTLPDPTNSVAGYTMKLRFFNDNIVTITTNISTIKCYILGGGSYASQSFNPTAGKTYELVWDGNAWGVWS
ncbi:hypothetical protein ABK905_07425 [Acerihabitans sp. KWT182]|uniref:Uncharacterized protein n=1 Tax=Acerihabitans sp. KWT182 TaxID=3157919 RepID=A0AAU7QCS2_9GAMM